MKNIILFSTLLFTTLSFAQDLKIEPIYSIETTRLEYPKPPKQVTNTYLGVSALYGVPLISAEFEVAQALTHNSYPSEDMKVVNTTRRAMLGIRSYPVTSKYFGLYFRAGVSAKDETIEITKEGEKTTQKPPLRINPYAGTGLTVAFNNLFSLNAGATLVYNQTPGLEEKNRYDVQYTLSAGMKVGNR